MAKVTKEMGIMDIVQQHPEAIAVFQKYGMGCIGCAAAHFENLEAGLKFTVLIQMKWWQKLTQL